MLGKDQVWKVSDKVSKPLSPYPTASRSGMSEAPKSIFANISYSEASQPVCSGVLEEAGVMTGVAVVPKVTLAEGSDMSPGRFFGAARMMHCTVLILPHLFQVLSNTSYRSTTELKAFIS